MIITRRRVGEFRQGYIDNLFIILQQQQQQQQQQQIHLLTQIIYKAMIHEYTEYKI